MMALGCDLVADDQCEIHAEGDALIARCPENIKSKIEARRFGILECAAIDQARLTCAVDLDVLEDNRLPEPYAIELQGYSLRLFKNPGLTLLPFALLTYLKSVGTSNSE